MQSKMSRNFFVLVTYAKIFLDIRIKFPYNMYCKNSLKRKFIMSLSAFVIFALCMTGCALHAYYLGRRLGITATVEHLIEIGVVEVDDEED